MGGGDGGASWKMKKTARKFLMLRICGSFCHRQQQTHVSPVSNDDSLNYSSSSLENQKRSISSRKNIISTETGSSSTILSSSHKNLCAICLDPLNYTSGSQGAKAIFTAQCSHTFHFTCIISNIQHGSITCPICRAQWTQLPHNLNNPCPQHNENTQDPVLHILDDSTATSFLQFNDPFEPVRTSTQQPRLSFSLLTYPNFNPYLRVKLDDQPATDLVLVAYPNGPRLRLMKQAMALVVSSLRPIDRLAIVTHSSEVACACTFRRMSNGGKRTYLKIIDQLFYNSQTDPTDGLEKGVKILEDRVRENPRSCILHLTDTPSRSYNHWFHLEFPTVIYQFNLGFGGCNGFEEFVGRTLRGRAEDIQLRIGERMMVVRIGELRGGEERNIPWCIGRESGRVLVRYSYRDGECIRTGDIVMGIEEEDDKIYREDGRRLNNHAENWNYHDSFMGRGLALPRL